MIPDSSANGSAWMDTSFHSGLYKLLLPDCTCHTKVPDKFEHEAHDEIPQISANI